MLRVVLVLMLTVAVGVGVVGRDASCTGDDCGTDADASDHQGGGDDCPPLCGGCPRVASMAAPAIRLIAAPRRADRVVAVSLAPPPAAPPRTGLFRPPRA